MKLKGLFVAVTLILGVTGAAQTPTIDELLTNSKPEVMIEYKGGITMEISYSGFEDERQNEVKITRSFAKNGEYLYGNEISEYPDNDKRAYYFSTEPDAKLQYNINGKKGEDELTDTMLESLFYSTFLGYHDFIVDVKETKEEEADYVVMISVGTQDMEIAHDVLTVDKESGFITKVERKYVDDEETEKEDADILTIEVDYSADVKVEPLFDPADLIVEQVTIESTDFQGNPVTMDDFGDTKLIMLNFWEPWCGPCVSEMPELQELYEAYKDQGLIIIGACAADNDAEEVAAVLNDAGVKYPIIKTTEEIAMLCSNYVPTTVFLDGEGNVLSEEPYVGADSYEGWEEVILQYLK